MFVLSVRSRKLWRQKIYFGNFSRPNRMLPILTKFSCAFYFLSSWEMTYTTFNKKCREISQMYTCATFCPSIRASISHFLCMVPGEPSSWLIDLLPVKLTPNSGRLISQLIGLLPNFRNLHGILNFGRISKTWWESNLITKLHFWRTGTQHQAKLNRL